MVNFLIRQVSHLNSIQYWFDVMQLCEFDRAIWSKWSRFRRVAKLKTKRSNFWYCCTVCGTKIWTRWSDVWPNLRGPLLCPNIAPEDPFRTCCNRTISSSIGRSDWVFSPILSGWVIIFKNAIDSISFILICCMLYRNIQSYLYTILEIRETGGSSNTTRLLFSRMKYLSTEILTIRPRNMRDLPRILIIFSNYIDYNIYSWFYLDLLNWLSWNLYYVTLSWGDLAYFFLHFQLLFAMCQYCQCVITLEKSGGEIPKKKYLIFMLFNEYILHYYYHLLLFNF